MQDLAATDIVADDAQLSRADNTPMYRSLSGLK